MPQILVWKCPETGNLYEDKEKYIKHLKKLASTQISKKKFQRALDKRNEVFKRMRDTCASGEEIGKFITDNIEVFWVHGHTRFGQLKNSKIPPVPTVARISLTGDFREEVSNSHNCPFNGVQNWEGKEGLPKGYPGFRGRISFEFTSNAWPGSDMWRGTGINTGSGGGSNKSGQYELFIYLDDWPAINAKISGVVEEHKKKQMTEVLQGKRYHTSQLVIEL